MLWFVLGIAVWVLLLLVCWIVLDESLASTRPAKPPHPTSEERRPPLPASPPKSTT